MRVKYCGPAYDYSGYGEANRHDIGSLLEAGVEVTAQIPRYCLEVSDFGKLGEKIAECENKELGYRIKIMHTTPNVYEQFYEPNKYHIGRVFWETDKIPLDFAKNVQNLDEIWTGSEFNAQAIRNAGVTVPIKIITEAIDTDIDLSLIKPYKTGLDKQYKFYSMFEWTERKNPSALLEAYWREFEGRDDVSLTLKTYVDNFTPEKHDEILANIKRIKKRLALSHYAPLYIFTRLMDRHQIYRFHKSFDCFVSPHRGEGWGIPQMEALLVGNPIISTNCGGIHEYLRNKQDALLLDYNLIPLEANTRNSQWYTPDQRWADISIDQLREYMRFAYDNQKKMKAMGKSGQTIVKKLFSLKAVGQKMRKRLEEINEELHSIETI